MDYLLHHPLEPVDTAELEAQSGVGVVVSPEEIESAVRYLDTFFIHVYTSELALGIKFM